MVSMSRLMSTLSWTVMSILMWILMSLISTLKTLMSLLTLMSRLMWARPHPSQDLSIYVLYVQAENLHTHTTFAYYIHFLMFSLISLSDKQRNRRASQWERPSRKACSAGKLAPRAQVTSWFYPHAALERNHHQCVCTWLGERRWGGDCLFASAQVGLFWAEKTR